MNTLIKSFQALSTVELYAILQARNEVFVVEQNCVYQDADGVDAAGLHAVIEEEGVLLAYCRLLPPGIKYAEWSIGRVLTTPKGRGKGLAHILIKAALEEIGNHPVRISAQSHLESFYQTHGFKTQGALYYEDGIPHIEMLRAA